MPDQHVRLALQALREADRDLEAPRAVEARLLSTLRMKRRQKRAGYLRIAGVAAVILIATAVSLAVRGREPLSDVSESKPRELSWPDSRREPAPVMVAKSAPGARARVAAVRARATPAREPSEIVTDFYPLLDAAPPLDRARVVRVVVPARTMRTVGLPVREEVLDDGIEADVLVGEEGMARAIRFVRTTGN